MPSDNLLPADEQPKPTKGDASRPFRSTGRDASALPESGERTLAPELPTTSRPQVRAGIAVLRAGTPPTREQLIATLMECQDAIQKGLRPLGAEVPCSPYGEIDLLAIDRFNRLTVVEIETVPSDLLLLRGMSHVNWVWQNVLNMQRMFPGVAVDTTEYPELVLVAPGFSPVLCSAVEHMSSPTVTCIRYHPVAISSGTGIIVEHVRHADDWP